MDKSGFKDNQDCIYAWSKKGKKVYGEQEEKRAKRENLVAGRRKKEKDLTHIPHFKYTTRVFLMNKVDYSLCYY
ncbi:transposase [Trichodesmium erythraeum 21-75]|jgi:hypothetical protein|nr:transposase [Trichodesmium erythraeum 21-75]